MKAEILISERLVLRPLTKAYATKAYVNWMNDLEVIKHLESGGNYTLKMLQNYLEEQEERDIYFWAIHEKSTNKHIGNIKIDPINDIVQEGEYGIMMGDRNSWGKGYAKEASKIIIDYCFDNLKLNAINLGVLEENKAAVALYEKLDFSITEKKKTGKKQRQSLRMKLINERE